ncbi:MAG: transcriptional regulator [Armatimonadetes bacterium CG_4_10_14_3_um_filter_66_18]|nr:type II toxin-antitoxin system PemK/MazF family toxin [Armatimonadota bacterium]PIX46426.1 MAG: transcriptional regulator [Armatimonadetes bacterium CG_4_8_14_3_um_filter_66_20]PIY53367.1 MAG: transcriptional regulator [Armatimonadetes bacterium CG_4_10_14_3_um_filter_66_18]
MLRPGDVVTVDFVGAIGTKRRPAVVVTTQLYHSPHPDVVLAGPTTQLTAASTPTDHVLQDWFRAGLHSPSAFRAYLGTYAASSVTASGHLSDRDWQAVQTRLTAAIALN